jgi:hypothetical protein
MKIMSVDLCNKQESLNKITPGQMNLFCGLAAILIGVLITPVSHAEDITPKYGDMRTVSFPTQTAKADWQCTTHMTWGDTCIGWVGSQGNFKLDWSPSEAGWVITGQPTISKEGSDGSWVDPIHLLAGGTPIVSKNDVTEAFQTAIQLADLENKTSISKIFQAELEKRLAVYGAGDSIQNTLHVSGGCNTTGILGDRKGCSVSVSGTVNIMYVGDPDGLELLTSLKKQYGL